MIENKISEQRHCITVDLIPEDEDRQDELNRIMRKPGDPPYNPNAKWHDPPVVPPNGTQEKPGTDSQKS
jgi:hypothetical protein